MDLCITTIISYPVLVDAMFLCSSHISIPPKLQDPHTGLMVIISPFDFLTFRSFIKKYQNLDFATTVFVAKIRIRYNFGVGCVSVGR